MHSWDDVYMILGYNFLMECKVLFISILLRGFASVFIRDAVVLFCFVAFTFSDFDVSVVLS